MLEGPNLYVSRAAIKLTLDITGLVNLGAAAAKQVASALGLGQTRPGEPGLRDPAALEGLRVLVERAAPGDVSR